jgi:hypothetical protein
MSWRLRRVVEDVAFNNFHNNLGWKLKEVWWILSYLLKSRSRDNCTVTVNI